MRFYRRATPRRTRRPQRQQGAVLFLVLMIVAFSSLAATFAVQDSSYALSATRNAKEYTLARYAAESGVNTLPAYVTTQGSEKLRKQLSDLGKANVALTADGGVSQAHARLHMPQPDGTPQELVTSKSMEEQLFDDGDGPQPSMVHNLRQDDDAELPREAIYESVIEGRSGSNGMYHFTVSTYGRVTSRWDDAAGTYAEPATGDVLQNEDENWYHEVVSVSRGYYTKF